MEISDEDWIVNCPASDVDIRQFLPGVVVLDDIADNSLYVDPSLGTPLEPLNKIEYWSISGRKLVN